MPNWCSINYQIAGKQQNVQISLKDCKKFSVQTEAIKRKIHFYLTLRGSDMSLVTFGH